MSLIYESYLTFPQPPSCSLSSLNTIPYVISSLNSCKGDVHECSFWSSLSQGFQWAETERSLLLAQTLAQESIWEWLITRPVTHFSNGESESCYVVLSNHLFNRSTHSTCPRCWSLAHNFWTWSPVISSIYLNLELQSWTKKYETDFSFYKNIHSLYMCPSLLTQC